MYCNEYHMLSAATSYSPSLQLIKCHLWSLSHVRRLSEEREKNVARESVLCYQEKSKRTNQHLFYTWSIIYNFFFTRSVFFGVYVKFYTKSLCDRNYKDNLSPLLVVDVWIQWLVGRLLAKLCGNGVNLLEQRFGKAAFYRARSYELSKASFPFGSANSSAKLFLRLAARVILLFALSMLVFSQLLLLLSFQLFRFSVLSVFFFSIDDIKDHVPIRTVLIGQFRVYC